MKASWPFSPRGFRSGRTRLQSVGDLDRPESVKPDRGSSDAAERTASQVLAFPAPQMPMTRLIDWYVKSRGLPPVIAEFLDTHWRSYATWCYVIEGEESTTFADAGTAIRELAWSARPKRDALSRRRLIELIPRLHEQLLSGIQSPGVNMDATEREAFFAELAKLHQAALHAQ